MLKQTAAILALTGWALCQCAAAGPAFPLRASADGRYLVDAAGKPFFYHADTVWQLPKKASLAVAEEYFDRRVKDGFTAVQLHTVSKEVAPVSNLNGDEPFVPLEDILKPNVAYWRHLDAILEAAEKRGLFVTIAALWIRWGGEDKEGWRYQLTDDNARAYGQFLGKRYAARKNILWILGGDANPGEKQRAVSLMGHAYGHRELWKFTSQWRQAMEDTGSKQMRHVIELFATRAWWKLEPDLDGHLVVGAVAKPVTWII